MRRRALIIGVAATFAAAACAKQGPPPQPPAPPPVTGPVRVGGGIKEPRKLKDVRPEYPAIAREARVQGLVMIETLIDTQGRVSEAKVVRGIPLLDQSALDAVRQWVFTPTLLNGVPVEVIMTVTVTFNLQ
jgi:protein TonB